MIAAALALWLAVTPPPPADSPPERVLIEEHFTRDGGIMGRAAVYLPPGYAQHKGRRYPLLMLLHGLGGDHTDWVLRGRVWELLDQGIRNGDVEPLIVVMPDGGEGYWVDWPGDAPEHRFETLVDDARRWTERTFRTDGRRAIAGLSSGGFGALSIALRRPGVYTAAVSLSGALFTEPPTGRGVYLAAFGYPGVNQYRFAWRNPIDLIRLGYGRGLDIWLDCGAQDAKKFTVGLREMSRVLDKAKIKHVTRFRPGRHQWEVWTAGLQDALPWLSARWTP